MIELLKERLSELELELNTLLSERELILKRETININGFIADKTKSDLKANTKLIEKIRILIQYHHDLLK